MTMLPRNVFDRVWIMEELNILHKMDKPLVIFLPGTAADPHRWEASAPASLAKYTKLSTVSLLRALALNVLQQPVVFAQSNLAIIVHTQCIRYPRYIRVPVSQHCMLC